MTQFENRINTIRIQTNTHTQYKVNNRSYPFQLASQVVNRAASTGSRQLGHVRLRISQSSMQPTWQVCIQGKQRTGSPAANSSIQMTHSRELFCEFSFDEDSAYRPTGKCWMRPMRLANLICSSSVRLAIGRLTDGDGQKTGC